jgi:hypothetical protein
VRLDFTSVPSSTLAVIESLRFNDRTTERLCAIPAEEWPALLKWCDDRQVTLLVNALHANALPESVRTRMAGNRDRYAERFARLQSELAEIVDALNGRGIDFVLLKGITHAPALTPEPLLRAQGDIDLWFAPETVQDAHGALSAIGYAPTRRQRATKGRRHLAPMIRPSGWKWRGDMFDPEMPVQVEAHYQLWNGNAEYIRMPGQPDFWNRRTARDFGGRSISVLSPPDLLGFAALHFLLHLLHGDLPLQRAWEIAHFLHQNAGDGEFWRHWRQLHSPALRRLEALAFAIAQIWFHCDVHESVQREIHGLADDVRLWLDHFAFSPLKQRSDPNKDELWLHLALIPSAAARARVLFRRLFPLVVGRKGGLSGSRLAHHRRTFTPALLGGLQWLRLKRQAGRAAVASHSPWRESPKSLHAASDPRSSSSPIPPGRFEELAQRPEAG